MTDPNRYVEQALAAMEPIKTEAALVRWDNTWCNSHEYLQLSESQVKQLEEAYHRKLGWLLGVGA